MARLKADIEPHTEQASELIFKEEDKERLLDDEGQYEEMGEGLEEIMGGHHSQKTLSKWIDYTDFKTLFYDEKGVQPDEAGEDTHEEGNQEAGTEAEAQASSEKAVDRADGTEGRILPLWVDSRSGHKSGWRMINSCLRHGCAWVIQSLARAGAHVLCVCWQHRRTGGGRPRCACLLGMRVRR
ncbi:MAG: hypothetical protein Q9O62_01925 [Ardenticatenia bacterium]|nr:hypothetical protein [Ardenticatenia bacterium]